MHKILKRFCAVIQNDIKAIDNVIINDYNIIKRLRKQPKGTVERIKIMTPLTIYATGNKEKWVITQNESGLYDIEYF